MGKRNRKRYLFTSDKARECQLISTEARRIRKAEFLATQCTQPAEEHPVGTPRYNLRDRTATAISGVSLTHGDTTSSPNSELTHIQQLSPYQQEEEQQQQQIEPMGISSMTPPAPKPRRAAATSRAKKPTTLSPTTATNTFSQQQHHYHSGANSQYIEHHHDYYHLEEEESEEEEAMDDKMVQTPHNNNGQFYPYNHHLAQLAALHNVATTATNNNNAQPYAPHDNFSLYQPQPQSNTIQAYSMERQRVSQYNQPQSNLAVMDNTQYYGNYNDNQQQQQWDPSGSEASASPHSRPSSAVPSPSFSYSSGLISAASVRKVAKLTKKSIAADYQRLSLVNNDETREQPHDPQQTHIFHVQNSATATTMVSSYSSTAVSASTLFAQSSMRNAPMTTTPPSQSRSASSCLENAISGLELSLTTTPAHNNVTQTISFDLFTPVPGFGELHSPIDTGLGLGDISTNGTSYLDHVPNSLNGNANMIETGLDMYNGNLSPQLHPAPSQWGLELQIPGISSQFNPINQLDIAMTPSAPLFEMNFDQPLADCHQQQQRPMLSMSKSNDYDQVSMCNHHNQTQNNININNDTTTASHFNPNFGLLNDTIPTTDLYNPYQRSTTTQPPKLSQLNTNFVQNDHPLVGNVTTSTGAQVEDFFSTMAAPQPFLTTATTLTYHQQQQQPQTTTTPKALPPSQSVTNLHDMASAV